MEVNSPDTTACLLVGHGTRNAAGREQFETVYRQFAAALSPQMSGFAYLELAEPSIPQAIEHLAMLGATRVLTVPVLLFAAGHALTDIPQEVGAACERYGLQSAGQSPPLELSREILQLSALRFRQAVCAADCQQVCTGAHCPRVALALVGRGSRSDEATARMREFARRRREWTPVAELYTAFVFAQRPSVPEVLEQLAASACPTVVVQPHLLFEGELVEQLREQVAAAAAGRADQRWVITPTLGTDVALADRLAELAASALTG